MIDPSTNSAIDTKPVLVFDGDCRFCRWSVERIRSATGHRIDYQPYQSVAHQYPSVPPENFARAVQLIEPDGAVSSAAKAVFRAYSIGADRRWPLWMYRNVPGFAAASEAAYRAVAASRPILSPSISLLYGGTLSPSTYAITRRVFERGLGVIYLIAFLSLWVQIIGLIGAEGILPIGEYLTFLHHRLSNDAYVRVPTIAWLWHSDQALHAMCAAGTLFSILAVFRIAPGPVFAILWMLYLSLTNAGQDFLSFQWDMLLLETGLLAVFLAPWRLRPRASTEPPPSRLFIWLIRLLLFRLMFLSGMTKLQWQDPCWTDFTALTYHYWTQCLPNSAAWYVHHAPLWLHKFCCASMLVIEIVAPFLMFIPRRPRLLCFWLQVILQLTIIATGNYTYFNWLTMLLCVSLLDDAAFSKIRRAANCATACSPMAARRRAQLGSVIRVPVGLFLGVLGALQVVGTTTTDPRTYRSSILPLKVEEFVETVSWRTRSINSYGLFRNMTKQRYEIVLEGSDDGRDWKPYEFKYKPGDPSRRPPIVAPHQPRLDWQMWFAPLGSYKSPRNAWFQAFMTKVHEGSPAVLGLMASNPFPETAPRFLRAALYDYKFTTPDERATTGHWWHRESKGLYCPVRNR